jgi:Na+-transporting NADH:ubiquinone oxidoreductase subunit A
MAKTVKLTKGYDIKLEGEALRFIKTPALSRNFAIKPTDFRGIIPKLLVDIGSEVKVGDPLFHSKTNEKMVFTSPVSGEIVEINRGEKRVIEEIVILSDAKNNFVDFGAQNPNDMDRQAIIDKMLASGVWPFVRQRPFNKIANPEETPKSIFISGFDSAPLAPDYNYILEKEKADFQTGIDVLKKLTEGNVHLNLDKNRSNCPTLEEASGVQITKFDGPHPAGNVGVQIHHLDPVINRNDLVWTVNPQDLLIIGRLFNKGQFDSSKLIAVAGSEVKNKQYYKMSIGACVSPVLDNNTTEGHNRVILGNVLTGKHAQPNGYIGFYDQMLTVIPEGDKEEFLGWLIPTYPRPSISRTLPSFLMPEKKYKVNTGMHGEDRAFVVTGEYEKVLPMDILPVYLIKACMARDVENMESLGIYEVDEEDLALCEFVCTSKAPIQEIIREGLNYIETEA